MHILHREAQATAVFATGSSEVCDCNEAAVSRALMLPTSDSSAASRQRLSREYPKQDEAFRALPWSTTNQCHRSSVIGSIQCMKDVTEYKCRFAHTHSYGDFRRARSVGEAAVRLRCKVDWELVQVREEIVVDPFHKRCVTTILRALVSVRVRSRKGARLPARLAFLAPLQAWQVSRPTQQLRIGG